MTKAHIRSFAIGFIALAAIVGMSAFAALTQRADAATSVSAGDLIRGQSLSAVYYMGADGFRYVFPNDKAYFTWYSDFSTVKWLSDAQLGEIQLGGNVTYKPGVKMVKITSRPNVYVVTKGGVLYHVDSESVAASYYGSNWNTKIDDIPDGFFSNYTVEEDTSASEYGFNVATALASVTGINDDKSLIAPEEISITANGYSPIDVTIEEGQTVRFTNNDTERHTVSADDGSWGSGTIQAGGTFVKRFTESGTYTFYDSYDEGNTGAIYVE